MKMTDNADYSPSDTYNQFLNQLSWRLGNITNSAYSAFSEAIRRDISRSDAFFDVAERIWRSYCPVNWGVLNWQWKRAFRNSNVPVEGQNALATFNQSPGRPPFQPLETVGSGNGTHSSQNWDRHPNPNHPGADTGNGTAGRNGQYHGNGHSNGHNGAKQRRRGGASLISYYA